jgi:hypothetical protein
MSRLSAWVRAMIRRAKARRTSVSLPLMEESFPVVCCWSPKAGCTTVLKWFLKHTGKLEEALRYDAWLHNYRTDRLFQQPGYERLCQRAVRSDRFRVIKVIRDPAQRVVSAYLHYLRVEPQGWQGTTMLAHWKAEQGLGSQEGCSFRQFLQFIRDIDDFGSLWEPHVRPQYDRAVDPHVDDFIPLENIAIGLAETERLCGLPYVDIQALSESVHHNRPSGSHRWPSDASSLPATTKTLDDLGVPPADILLDNETIPLVQRIYACDYRAYARHYSPPHRKVAT